VTVAKVMAVPGWRELVGRAYNYADQGGWGCYTWQGVERYVFFFREEGGSIAGATHAIHAGNTEGMITKISERGSRNSGFAGIVCIQD
jgi:hypothetical protein